MSLSNRLVPFTGKLNPEDYQDAIKKTQIVSVDLLVRNHEGKYLVGLRKNKPAQGTYFIPGGRVYANETIRMGLQRVARDELGIDVSTVECEFRGVYEHVYPDNFTSDDFGTHYVVFAYHIELAGSCPVLLSEKMADQHHDFMWLSAPEMRSHPDVHEYTKLYSLDNDYNRVN
jgi:colanic acid biosynthesis protein WcaH